MKFSEMTKSPFAYLSNDFDYLEKSLFRIFSDAVKNAFSEHTNILHRLQQLHGANHPSRQGKLPNSHKNDYNNDNDSETSTTTRRYENSEATTTTKEEGNETGVIRKEIDYLKQKYEEIRRDIDKWMVRKEVHEFSDRG